MIKRLQTKFNPKFQYRINDRIGAPTLRVLDSENKQVGVLSKFEALKLAKEQEIDLVEIAPAANPPVAKLIDFNKFLYQLSKKKQEEKKKAKVSETKEIRLGPFMGAHDLETMANRAKEFLEAGDKVRLVVKFRGRQVTRPEFGKETIAKLYSMLESISKIDREAKLEGRQMIAILSPERKKQNAEEKNQESSQQEI